MDIPAIEPRDWAAEEPFEPRFPIERSAAHEVLLRHPRTCAEFSGQDLRAASGMISRFLRDFENSGATDQWEFAGRWVPGSADGAGGDPAGARMHENWLHGPRDMPLDEDD